MPDLVIQQLHEDISRDMARIAKRFKPGAKLTLIVRNPTADKEPGSADVVLTDDEVSDAIAALRRFKNAGNLACDCGRKIHDRLDCGPVIKGTL